MKPHNAPLNDSRKDDRTACNTKICNIGGVASRLINNLHRFYHCTLQCQQQS